MDEVYNELFHARKRGVSCPTAERMLAIEREFLTASEDDMDDLIATGLEMIADLEAARANSKAADAWLAKLNGAGPGEEE